MVKLVGDPAIQAARRENEREILCRIRRAMKDGYAWSPIVMPIAWHNALGRLIARKRVRYNRKKMGYVIVRRVWK